jgi:PGF-pre-PGF domain-containing protein
MKFQFIALFVVVLFTLPLASAALIPSTSPCWIKGTVSIDGSVANSDGAVLTATVAGTQQKSTTLDATGVFDFNSLAGNDGDTVLLKVCGLYNSSDTNMQFTFTGFCNTTDAQPWITKTINFSKQADETVGCTCDAVCTGGLCVNPGTTGVCSSNDYYCDSDGTCESAFGETTSTCPSDCYSGGGGGGGSGGGAVSNPQTSQSWAQITPGVVIIMKISSDDFGIKEIILTLKNLANNVKIIIEKLPGKPADVTQNISGKVFRYLKITTVNLDDANINGMIKIKFQVTQSWLIANGIDPKNIVLMRFANNTWNDLVTTLLSSDDKYSYYEAESPGLSYFAIGVRSTVTPIVIPPVTPPTTPPAETPAEQPPATTPPAETPAQQPPTTGVKTTTKKPSVLAIILVMIAVFMAIVLIILGFTRKRKRPANFKTLEEGE